MEKMVGNAIDDLCMLSTSITIIGYILVATFLFDVLIFDLEISESRNAGTMTIFFFLSFMLAYKYGQALKKLKVYEGIFEEALASGPFPDCESRQACTSRKNWQKLLDKSKVRRFSYPITPFKYSSLLHNWERVAINGFEWNNGHQLITETGVTSSNDPNEFMCKGYNEIPAILQNCAKDLGNVIKLVKSLNLAYIKNFEDTSILNQNSTPAFQEENLNSQIAEEEEKLTFKLESAKPPKEKEKLPLKLESAKPPKEKAGTEMINSSLPQAHNEDVDTKQKPIETTKLVLANPFINFLWKSLVLNGGNPFLLDIVENKFLFKSIFIDKDGSGYYFARIPSNKHDLFSRENLNSEIKCSKRMVIDFYKKNAVVKHDDRLLVSIKKHVPKIPMIPYVRQISITKYMQGVSMRKISMTKYMQEISLRGYIYSLSIRKSKIKNNEQTVSKDTRGISKILPTISAQGLVISVDEMLLSIKQSLIAVMADTSTLSNDILIPKFKEADFKKFVYVYQELNEKQIHA